MEDVVIAYILGALTVIGSISIASIIRKYVYIGD